MGDIICKWRVANIPNLIELVNMLPHEVLPNDVFRDRMGAGFMRTPYQLACQLGLYFIDENDNYIPRFRQSINEEEARSYLHRWILRYYAPNPYTPSFRKEMTETKVLVPALVEYVEKHPNCIYEDACNAIYGEIVGNSGSILGAINSFSDVLEIDRNHIVKLRPNYKEVLMADRLNKEDFFSVFNTETKKPPIDQPHQIIYYGAPGTGKSHTIDCICPDDVTIRTTFHPDTDYASFVGAYKPTMEEVPLSAFVGKEVHIAQPQGEHLGKEKKIVYKFVPQAFLKAYVAAWTDLENPHYLVIEEINRGNCAQIFGDLFQLLDRNNSGSSSYAIHADEDIAQFLRDDKRGFGKLTGEQRDAISKFELDKGNGQRVAIGAAILSGKKLLLPPNLYIWATMNTSDQSLFPIDSAFKRRWNWKYIPIDYNKEQWQFEVGGIRYLWADFLRKINRHIHTLTDSEDKQMGYFFAKADKKTSPEAEGNDLISEDIFLNKVLFYLWTDVLKDFDAGQEPFLDSETKATYNFSDFFDPEKGKDKITEFISKLGLSKVGAPVESEGDDFDSPEDADLNANDGNTLRDYSKYSVNGKGRMSKSDAVVAAMTAFVKALPELSATEILAKIDELNLSNRIAYSEDDFNMYREKSYDPRFAKRFARIETASGEPIFVYKGSTPKRIGELIIGLSNSGVNVVLAKVE